MKTHIRASVISKIFPRVLSRTSLTGEGKRRKGWEGKLGDEGNRKERREGIV
jgi:hypothetical protein